MPLILLADDDDILIDLVRHHLEAAGYKVLVANDGRSALEAAKSTDPDLVILDAMMPILSGQEVLRALRDDAKTAKIPIMMLTARKGEDDVVDAFKSGANEYMTKPFRPQELAVRVESLIRAPRN